MEMVSGRKSSGVSVSDNIPSFHHLSGFDRDDRNKMPVNRLEIGLGIKILAFIECSQNNPPAARSIVSGESNQPIMRSPNYLASSGSKVQSIVPIYPELGV